MSEAKDCRVCLHNQVCRYVQHFQTLAQLGQLEFNCRMCLSKENSKTQNKTAKPVVKDEHPELSLNELSRLVNKDAEDDEKPASEKGVCSICGKESENIYTCGECGQKVCGNCGDLTTMLDPFTGETSNTFICHNCDD